MTGPSHPRAFAALFDAPELGSQWVHARNRRLIVVVGIEHSGGTGKPWKTTVTFKYRRSAGSLVGFRRGVAPSQTMPLAEWKRFFTERAAEQPKENT